MRILFICGGGVIYGKETVTLSLMEGLCARGHEVYCITSTWGDAFAKELDTRSIPYTRLPLGFISKTLRWESLYMTFAQLCQLPRLGYGYWRTLKSFKPDFIIHSTFHFLFLLWPLLDSERTLFHVHDYFKPTMFYRLLIRFLSLRVRAFIAVSRFIRNSLLQLGLPPSKVFSVLNGIDLQTNGVHRTISHPTRIGIVGQIGEWKGHGDLLEALNILNRWQVPFNCIIFGEGEPKYIEMLQRQAYQHEIDRKIHLAGYVKDKRKIFSAIDICVIPSRCEDSFGMVAAEAAYFGAPVIATKRGGLTEIVLEGETGYLIAPESPQELAEKLKLFIENPELWRKMGEAARAYAYKRFTRDRMVQEMEDILLNLNHV